LDLLVARRRRQHPRKEAGPPSSAAAAPESRAGISKKEKLLWAAGLLLAYAYIATWGQLDFSDLMGYYSMQADAFRQGHLYISRTPEQGYLMDLIPFEGHLYLQWGPFPAVVHLLVKVLGGNLSDRVACILAGWLTSLVFLQIVVLIRRHFPDLPAWACRWLLFGFAFGTPTAIVALRGTIYHESIAIADLCVLSAFLAFLHFLDRRSARGALVAGLALGLAILTRVTQAIYAAGLFAGIAAIDYRNKEPRRAVAAHLSAFSAPVAAAVLLMMWWNQARFHSPFEYGTRFMPTEDAARPPYALTRAPENFRHYVLAPIKVSRDLPWLAHQGWLPLKYTLRAEDMSSMFLASPFLLLGLLSWKLFRSKEPRLRQVKVFGAVAGLSGLAVFFSLLCFVGTSRRYMQDFFPEFMILVVLGMAAHAKPGEDWRRWRGPAWGVAVLSAFIHLHLSFFQSVNWAPLDPNVEKTFVAWSPVVRRILPGHELDARDAIDHNDLGILCLNQRRYQEAIRHFERARELMPHSQPIQANLRLARQMQIEEARGRFGSRN
jgi:hypothetical protein